MSLLAIAYQGREAAAAVMEGGDLLGSAARFTGPEGARQAAAAAAVEAALAAAHRDPADIRTVVRCAAPEPEAPWRFAGRGRGGPTALGAGGRRALGRLAPGLTGREGYSVPPLTALAAYAYYPAFQADSVLILWPDGGQPGISGRGGTFVFRARDKSLRPLWRLAVPHDPGGLVQRVGEVLGLHPERTFYELAYLAQFGRPRHSRRMLDSLVTLRRDGSFAFRPLALDRGDRPLGTWLASLLGDDTPLHGRRDAGAADLARSVTAVVRYLVAHMVVYTTRVTRARAVCLGGDGATRLARFGMLPREPWMRQTWVAPQTGAVALAAGAAMCVWHGREPGALRHAAGPYLGPAYSELALQGFLTEGRIPADTLPSDRAPGRAAELVEHGNRVGWFQGRESAGVGLAGDRAVLSRADGARLQPLADPGTSGAIPPPLTLFALDEAAGHLFADPGGGPFASVGRMGPLLTAWRNPRPDDQEDGGVSARGPVMLLRVTARSVPALYRFLVTLAEQRGDRSGDRAMAVAEPLFPDHAPGRAPADAYDLLRAGAMDALVLGDSVLYQGPDLPELPAPVARNRPARLWARATRSLRDALRVPATLGSTVRAATRERLAGWRPEPASYWRPAPGSPPAELPAPSPVSAAADEAAGHRAPER